MSKSLMTVVLVIVFAAAGFYGGTLYQKGKTPTFAAAGAAGTRQFGVGGTGTRGARGGAVGGGQVIGQITSASANSITVQLTDGSSKIVIISPSTPISKSTAGTPADLTSGQRVAIFGTTNGDGSVTAQTVQLNPTMRGFGGQPSGAPSAAPTQ